MPIEKRNRKQMPGQNALRSLLTAERGLSWAHPDLESEKGQDSEGLLNSDRATERVVHNPRYGGALMDHRISLNKKIFFR